MIQIKITPKYKPPIAELSATKKKRKSVFANIIISIVIAVGLIITTAVLLGYHELKQPIPGDVVTALMIFWGGELLIVALRQIFGSDVTKKNNTEDYSI